jgi:hypothetical protein
MQQIKEGIPELSTLEIHLLMEFGTYKPGRSRKSTSREFRFPEHGNFREASPLGKLSTGEKRELLEGGTREPWSFRKGAVAERSLPFEYASIEGCGMVELSSREADVIPENGTAKPDLPEECRTLKRGRSYFDLSGRIPHRAQHAVQSASVHFGLSKSDFVATFQCCDVLIKVFFAGMR